MCLGPVKSRVLDSDSAVAAQAHPVGHPQTAAAANRPSALGALL
jgi:hypothetical protein